MLRQWCDSVARLRPIRPGCCCVVQAFKFKYCLQAAQLAANEHTLASPEATAQMYVDQVVNGTEIDGLTPLHLALSNGVLCTLWTGLVYIFSVFLFSLQLLSVRIERTPLLFLLYFSSQR